MQVLEKRPKLGQIILRIDDEYGHHIIRKIEFEGRDHYTIEGHKERPKDYYWPPQYSFPFLEVEVAAEFKKQGKEWRTE